MQKLKPRIVGFAYGVDIYPDPLPIALLLVALTTNKITVDACLPAGNLRVQLLFGLLLLLFVFEIFDREEIAFVVNENSPLADDARIVQGVDAFRTTPAKPVQGDLHAVEEQLEGDGLALPHLAFITKP